MSLKRALQKLLFPFGTEQKIRAGYLKGKKIIVSENTQWAPIIGRWEPAMQKVMVNVIREGQTVYDLGANFGLHGLLCSQLIGPNGQLYNFEPLPSNISEIDRMYRLNKVTNYENIQAAVSSDTGVLKFSVAAHGTQGKLSDGSAAHTIDVKTVSLDNFIESGKRMPHFIKMDIEGAEGEALNGFSRSIEKCFPLMIIELHSPEADKKVGEFLKFYNYKAYRFETFNTLQFDEVKNLQLPYPHPEGIWGTVFCVGPNTSLTNYSFTR
jgi:FkbM family methyltransferase